MDDDNLEPAVINHNKNKNYGFVTPTCVMYTVQEK